MSNTKQKVIASVVVAWITLASASSAFAMFNWEDNSGKSSTDKKVENMQMQGKWNWDKMKDHKDKELKLPSFFKDDLTVTEKDSLKQIMDQLHIDIKGIIKNTSLTVEDKVTKVTNIHDSVVTSLTSYIKPDQLEAFKKMHTEMLDSMITMIKSGKTGLDNMKDSMHQGLKAQEGSYKEMRSEMKMIKTKYLTEAAKAKIEKSLEWKDEATQVQYLNKYIEKTTNLISKAKWKRLLVLQDTKAYLEAKLAEITDVDLDIDEVLN